MDPIKAYEYLLKTRERVFDAVRRLDDEQYRRPFPFGLVSIGSTLTHLMLSEWYYFERLAGRSVPPYATWPVKYETPPAFATVEEAWRSQASRIAAEIAGERDWSRTVVYDSLVADNGKRYRIRATAGEYIVQLVTHEVHHRAQAMSMLRMLGDRYAVSDIDYNDLMFDRAELASER